MAGPFHIDQTYGSDANSGLGSEVPKQTCAAVVALMDTSTAETIYQNGTIRNDVYALGARYNKTIATLPATNNGEGWALPVGSTVRPAVMRGDRLVTGTWTNIGNNVYTNDTAIPTGLTITALQSGWDTRALTSTGQHSWGMVLVATAAAVTTYATGTGGAKGVYHYASGTGLITAYFGGENPNTSGHATGYITAGAITGFVTYTSGGNITVSDIDMCLLPVYAGQFGWGVRSEGAMNCSVTGCVMDDMGAHSVGTLGGTADGSNFAVSNCIFRGMGSNASPIIFNQNLADGQLSGCTVSGCTVYGDRWLGIDGLVMHGRSDSVAALGANAVIGCYAHSNAGDSIAAGGIRISSTTFSATEATFTPFAADDAVAVTPGSGEFVPGNFPILVDYCIITGTFLSWNVANHDGSAYVRRTFISSTGTAAAGFGAGGFLNVAAGDSADYLWTFDSCVIRFSLDDTNSGADQTRMISGQQSTGGTKHLNFVNSTIINSGTDASLANIHSFVDFAAEAVNYAQFYGCIFAHVTAATNQSHYWGDQNINAATHVCLDNLYVNIDNANERYSLLSTINTAAEWVAGVDTAATVAANVTSTSPFTSSVTGTLNAAAQLLRRTTSTVRRSSTGINGVSGSTNFGAYEYIASSNVTGRNAGREAGTDRLPRGSR